MTSQPNLRSRIDHALHANDAASAAMEGLAYDQAFATVYIYIFNMYIYNIYIYDL